MPKKTEPLHPAIKSRLGYEPSDSDSGIIADWKARTKRICKPCWELKYCPYGPLVEDFPLLPVLREEAALHNEYLESCLTSGKLGDGRPLDAQRRKLFGEEIMEFNSTDYPESIPQILNDAACRVFGHICPVFFVAEPLTETKDVRTQSRSIPREVMLKVVRRDGQICQTCFEPVPDNQVEFDHVIPYSKGGTTTADNLKLVHRECNRKKGNSLKEILAPDPLVHYVALVKKNVRKTKKT
jgi:hypothetical protein